MRELELKFLKLEFHVDFNPPQLYQHIEIKSLNSSLKDSNCYNEFESKRPEMLVS